MAGTFSDTIKLADINDYITPELECVIQTGDKVRLNDDSLNEVKIKKKKTGHWNQILTNPDTKTAKITLNDCLACSGCVTSAETVLIKQQSIEQMETHLKGNNNAILVVTVAPQICTSFAYKYDTTPSDIFGKLTIFFKKHYGAKYIFDANIGLDITMNESVNEFVYRIKNDINIPVLTSECPGFICYAEKSCKKDILKYISKIKSPQQIMGHLIKKYLFNGNENVYHVTIMPCFDKKLEASRKDYLINDTNKEVDCVITSVELQNMLIEKNIDILNYETKNDDNITIDRIDVFNKSNNVTIDYYFSELIHDIKGSNGYMENIYIRVNKILYGNKVTLNDIKYKEVRNDDMEEIELTLNNGNNCDKLKFVRGYGFKNIKNIINRINKKRNKYNYIEIMACPSGCLNGGGQIKLKDNKSYLKHKKSINKMRNIHSNDARHNIIKNYCGNIKGNNNNNDVRIMSIYKFFRNIVVGNDKKWNDMIYTEYKHIDNTLLTPSNLQW